MYFNTEHVIKEKIILNHNINDSSNEAFNIAYGIDKNFIFGCGISIASILLHNKNKKIAFHIFTDFFDETNIAEFTDLCHQYNTQIVVYIINCDELKQLPSTKNWSYATYFRFIIADFFNNVLTTVLYLDADIVCNADLDELINLDLIDHTAAVVCEGEKPWWTKRALALGDAEISNGYFNAGFLLINIPRWGEQDISRQAMSLLADDDVKQKISFLDQDILNILFVNKVLFLDKRYNTQFSINYELSENKKTLTPITKNTVFIHYIGPTKPWHAWASDYDSSRYFMTAKQHSPWKETKLLKAHSANQLRYCAKHQFHNKKILSGLKSYFLYFLRKIS
ncbi:MULTISPECIES: lipopolysaccharide 3-alpha-galactosyltransferase [unclassified Symbiopectobacterium]|uniref:lipopolysaccharide 3-alpha-galactosyltransferase n=1 Tax=unclassified Symbiopectobacterium TaxID=2794573 RepID=UPI002226ADC1|nr:MULTISPECIES: lipopolysaccharide 3-alpha-galactosyltransferase [unclassified Symbiopectobacterium]MCW2476623.1 lipopolysaccharide 3-alpha-galactosyltransferase [Candidatus Symbiopectobacterium sp. NZEC151]MCW2481978.1 lipopolysaccharide 3-alpha-galactosyltransferase [Candidatus Symbiopectobacterium sp. NZEC135]MCW2488130.1 lipopolysaccharide 3-alpha-galactosyltransferase [Candidatus Symbiopectobacterium sp. NZEC127]